MFLQDKNDIISIIIPTYKPTPLLKETLVSISCQSIKKIELIIVVNGTQRSSVDVVKQWIDDLGLSAQILYSEMSGVSNARNLGLEIARGDYICFIDDDDLISKNYISELWNNRIPNGIVFSNIVIFSEKYKQTENKYSKAFYYLKNTPTPTLFQCRHLLNGPWGKLYPRKLIGNTRFNINLTRGEDGLFNFEISKNIKKIKTTDSSATYYYRLNPDGLTLKKLSFIKYLPIFNNQLKYLVTLYLKNIGKYNHMFFLSRILGCCKYLIISYGVNLSKK